MTLKSRKKAINITKKISLKLNSIKNIKSLNLNKTTKSNSTLAMRVRQWNLKNLISSSGRRMACMTIAMTSSCRHAPCCSSLPGSGSRTSSWKRRRRAASRCFPASKRLSATSERKWISPLTSLCSVMSLKKYFVKNIQTFLLVSIKKINNFWCLLKKK